MTAKLICEYYRCNLGPDTVVRVFGMTEYTEGTLGGPKLYMAIVHKRGTPPRQFDADSFDGAVTLIADAFGEPGNTLRSALIASTRDDSRAARKMQAADPRTEEVGLLIPWLKRLRKLLSLL
jgi:hypothetical protein